MTKIRSEYSTSYDFDWVGLPHQDREPGKKRIGVGPGRRHRPCGRWIYSAILLSRELDMDRRVRKEVAAMAHGDTMFVDRDKTLTQKVGEGLRHAILNGRLEPGQRLIERNLCEMTGVSRTAVREALRSLETEGLVINVPNRGPMVVSISVQEAREIYDVREILETRAVELFMKKMSDDDLAQLSEAMTKMERACKARDFELMNLEKDKFYDIIIDVCGNRLIRRVLNQVHGQIAVLRNMTIVQEGRAPLAFAEVKEIYVAILARNAKAAKRACRRHVENAGQVAIDSLVLKLSQ